MKLRSVLFTIAACCACALFAQELNFRPVTVEPRFPGHCQGICCDADFIYLSFTKTIIKVDYHSKFIAETPIASHAGDICLVDDKIYISQSLRGKNPGGYIVVMDNNLQLLQTIPLPQTPKPDGIAFLANHFYLANDTFGRESHPLNHVHQYDRDFKFLQSYNLEIGDTKYGGQAMAGGQESLWLGFYSNTRIVQADHNLAVQAKLSRPNCSEGICAAPMHLAGSNPRFLIARNINRKDDQGRTLYGSVINLSEFRAGEFSQLE